MGRKAARVTGGVSQNSFWESPSHLPRRLPLVANYHTKGSTHPDLDPKKWHKYLNKTNNKTITSLSRGVHTRQGHPLRVLRNFQRWSCQRSGLVNISFVRRSPSGATTAHQGS